MHELSLMDSALHIAADQAQSAGATRILSMTLRVGALSCVVPDSLRFAFEVLREGTLASTAELLIVETPVRALCTGCVVEFETTGPVALCPNCGAATSNIVSGREMDLVSMEVETP